MKTTGDKKRFLEALKENHIVLAACRKVGVGKSSYYRWRQDPEFAKAADEAIAEGIELVSEAAESNIITAIKSRDKEASKFWLKARHPAYTTKVRVEKVEPEAPLTTEEEQKLLEGLEKMASIENLSESEITNTNNDEYEKESESPTGVGGTATE